MLEGMTPPVRIPTCKVRTVKDQLEDSDAELLESYVMDNAWSTNALSGALKKRDVFLSPNTILKHRKGNCSC